MIRFIQFIIKGFPRLWLARVDLMGVDLRLAVFKARMRWHISNASLNKTYWCILAIIHVIGYAELMIV